MLRTGHKARNDEDDKFPQIAQRASSLRFPELGFQQVPQLGPRCSRKEEECFFLRRQLLQTPSFAFGSSFISGRNQLAIAAQTALQPKRSSLPAGPLFAMGSLVWQPKVPDTKGTKGQVAKQFWTVSGFLPGYERSGTRSASKSLVTGFQKRNR